MSNCFVVRIGGKYLNHGRLVRRIALAQVFPASDILAVASNELNLELIQVEVRETITTQVRLAQCELRKRDEQRRERRERKERRVG